HKMSDNYIHFDEIDDVLASVRLLAQLVPKLPTDPWAWKWVIIAAHNALQGALVCALSGPAGVGALEKQSAGAVLDWFEKRTGNPPKKRLADFNTLVARGCNAERMSYLGAIPLCLDSQQRKDLRRLNDEFRNNFMHFTPKGWSIERIGLPRIILTAVGAIGHLMSQPQVIYKLDDTQRHDMEDNLAMIARALQQSEL
ncbi:MAG TPA: hypothetical protein VNJ31_10660, partial [Methyloceanibacter sp.]|nr:hypothetical protein [Methyloceanibacter sp.]